MFAGERAIRRWGIHAGDSTQRKINGLDHQATCKHIAYVLLNFEQLADLSPFDEANFPGTGENAYVRSVATMVVEPNIISLEDNALLDRSTMEPEEEQFLLGQLRRMVIRYIVRSWHELPRGAFETYMAGKEGGVISTERFDDLRVRNEPAVLEYIEQWTPLLSFNEERRELFIPEAWIKEFSEVLSN